jgi:hypothetical protein
MPPGAFAASGPSADPQSKSRSVFADTRCNRRIYVRTLMFTRAGPGLRGNVPSQQNCRRKKFRQQCRALFCRAVGLEAPLHGLTALNTKGTRVPSCLRALKPWARLMVVLNGADNECV